MPTRWEVSDAITGQNCELPPTARHVMHVLIARSDTGSAVIPGRFSPSLMELARSTGLSKTAVSTALNTLERSGWVERNRPSTSEQMSAHARTGYALLIPAGCSRAEQDAVREANRTSARAEQDPVRDADRTRSRGEHNPVREADTDLSLPGSPGSPRRTIPPRSRRGQGLTPAEQNRLDLANSLGLTVEELNRRQDLRARGGAA